MDIFLRHSLSLSLECFRLGSHVIPTLKSIGVGGLLPRMIFHRLEPMFEYPEKWDFPIYIYTVSLFLMFFDVFCRVVFISQIGPFFDFFKIGPIQRDGIWFLSIFRFLAFFYFFWI